MVEVLEWPGAADPQTIVQRAVEALDRGGLVVFPTDTVYSIAASVQCPEAVERLMAFPGALANLPPPLAIASLSQALEWVPDMSPLGHRLAKRCWPGPVTLVFADGMERGLASTLPDRARQLLCADGALGLCMPDHDALWHVLRSSPDPVALASIPAGDGGQSATDLAQRLGDGAALVIDGGPVGNGKLPSVVRVTGDRWDVLQEGTVSAEEVNQQTACLIVFVCTGNTCRSPMAEALCSKLLADRLGCTPAELPRRGFIVLSAGVAAMAGDPAAPEAVEAVQEMGASLIGHASQPLSPELVHQADYLLTMTMGHAAAVAGRYAGLRPSPRLLCPEGNDIPDPIGADREVYRECARTIQTSLERLLAELQP